MIENGLLGEIEGLMAQIRSHVEASRIPLGVKGITQSIGFKEFEPYFQANDSVKEAIFNDCIINLKASTRQYAKRQLTWIRNRFVPRNIPVYKLDTTNLSQWSKLVSVPSLDIAAAFLGGSAIPIAPWKSKAILNDALKKVKHICDSCGGREFLGAAQWNEHLRSKGHQFHLKRLRLLASGQTFERSPHKKTKPADHGEALSF
jgi:tRNA dimethylallyltransferase